MNYIESRATYLQKFILRKNLLAKRIVYCEMELTISEMVYSQEAVPPWSSTGGISLCSLLHWTIKLAGTTIGICSQCRWVMMLPLSFDQVRLHQQEWLHSAPAGISMRDWLRIWYQSRSIRMLLNVGRKIVCAAVFTLEHQLMGPIFQKNRKHLFSRLDFTV